MSLNEELVRKFNNCESIDCFLVRHSRSIVKLRDWRPHEPVWSNVDNYRSKQGIYEAIISLNAK